MSEPLTDERLREAFKFLKDTFAVSYCHGQSFEECEFRTKHYYELIAPIETALAELAELRAKCEGQSALLAKCSIALEDKALNMTPPAKETGHE